MKRSTSIVMLLNMIIVIAFSDVTMSYSQSSWDTDFGYQVPGRIPALEVRYRDTDRDRFEIIAGSYKLAGDLLPPNLLTDMQTGKPWLWLEATDLSGKIFSTRFTSGKSRINLYRRGPYYCEVHWVDLFLADENGKDLPVKAELVLYCFPEKINGSVKIFPSESIDLRSLTLKGRVEKSLVSQGLVKERPVYFSFSLYGETVPLSEKAFTLLKGPAQVKYDSRRGVFVVGSETAEGFQRQYFEQPNGYEEVSFRIRNDGIARKIYICHKTLKGEGIVEGGMVLDENRYPLPLMVQVSKNFNGEKEERFYNPADTAFSETYFPLYLDPYEEVSISSLHLYQNWGRHMTKHWSSLGFFMDYFHSSTGVTETTCYIPFKFGHKTGITIGDFRAMSQETFWSGQPQHDNVAGHNFLTFHDGRKWNYSEYRGTTYKSTGPNWCNTEMEYLSSDSTIQLLLDIWEVPQDDELRSFFTARYRVLKELTVEDAASNFRFLDISSTQQSLRYKSYAYTAADGKIISGQIDFAKDPFCVKGMEMALQNSFAAVYGEPKGSNGIMIRSFRSSVGLKPAFTIQQRTLIPEPHDATVNEHKVYTPDLKKGDIRFSLVPAADRLVFRPGDEIVISGFWLPYGEVDGFRTPVREIARFGEGQPVIKGVKKGTVLNDLPVKIRVKDNEAEFTLSGGYNVIPVIATGFTGFRDLMLFRRYGSEWKPVYMNQNWGSDGGQVFCGSDGLFGAVFLVRTNGEEQEFRIAEYKPEAARARISLSCLDGRVPAVRLSDSKGEGVVNLRMNPGLSLLNDPAWKESEGNSVWFSGQSQKIKTGVRVTGFEEMAVIQCWWEPAGEADTVFAPEIGLEILKEGVRGGFRPWKAGVMKNASCFYSPKQDMTVILALRGEGQVIQGDDGAVSIRLKEQVCRKGRRKVFEAYLVMADGKPDYGLSLLRQEIPVPYK